MPLRSRRGVPISAGFVLVTHNATHFHRIRGLRVEDWY
jgi:predicted nucleic acid-binding protein